MQGPIHWFNRMFAFQGVPSACLARAKTLAARDAHFDAFPLFARAARAGLPEACYRLGRCYLLSLGVPPSINEALRWLSRAAEAGDAEAQTQLGSLALQGVTDRDPGTLFDARCADPDYDRAEYWCRRAGTAEAKALLAFILTAGPADRRDQPAGDELYRQSAEAGWSRGQLALATDLLRQGGSANTEHAAVLLHAAAADGIAAAHHQLGMLAESGATGAADFAAAAVSYKEAADLGHPPAQIRYGFALMHGRGVARDLFTAETWLRRAALAGDPQAAAVVGYLYVRNDDLPPNYAEAATWLRRAAESGHTGAARTLGRLLLLGAGVPRDIADAAHWLRMAAEGGEATARGDLVRLALTRQVGEDDRQTVAIWLRADAEAGDPAAQFDFALCLAQGIGTKPDERAALNWIRRAARAGHSGAIGMMAQMPECTETITD